MLNIEQVIRDHMFVICSQLIKPVFGKQLFNIIPHNSVIFFDLKNKLMYNQIVFQTISVLFSPLRSARSRSLWP